MGRVGKGREGSGERVWHEKGKVVGNRNIFGRRKGRIKQEVIVKKDC